MKLEGRVAIVTGAAQGIGRAIADKLTEEGATIAVADLNGDGAARSRRRSTGCDQGRHLERGGREADRGGDARALRPDRRARQRRRDRAVHPWDDVDFAYWRKIISVNLDGAYLVSRAVEGPMREAGYGRIVHIASNAFYAGTPNMGPYLAAKGGVVGLTRALATELGKYGITANAVAPGITRSEGALATPHKDCVRLRAVAPGDPAPRAAVGHRPGGRVPVPPRSRDGSPARCSSSTPATSATDGARGHHAPGRSSPSPTSTLARLLPRPAGLRARGDLRRPALRDARLARSTRSRWRSRAMPRRTARACDGRAADRSAWRRSSCSRSRTVWVPTASSARPGSVSFASPSRRRGGPPLFRGRPRRQPGRAGAALMRAVRLAGPEAIEVVAAPDPVLTAIATRSCA